MRHLTLKITVPYLKKCYEHPIQSSISMVCTIYLITYVISSSLGMWGWASKRPLWNFATPYWPETVFDDLNPNYLLLEVGAASSDHDRASHCEADHFVDDR